MKKCQILGSKICYKTTGEILVKVKYWIQILCFRLPDSDSSLILFILYAPFGLCLFIIRSIILSLLFIFLHILPESPSLQKFCNKIACIGLGISVSLDNTKIDDNVEAYVSNNVSIFDHLAVSQAVRTVSVSVQILEKYCWYLFYILACN